MIIVEETIAAISTPQGSGGIAVIRISGDKAVEIADKVYKGSKKLANCDTHTVHYGFIKDEKGEKTDEVLVTVMRAPRTFTREDVVEISTHGGMSASKAVLGEIIRAGARPAMPGEFTKRAFLNGRIDLSQAEAVIDIINSSGELSRKNALSQLEGRLSSEIKQSREGLVYLAAQMQVAIDYPDEDLEDITPEDISRILHDSRDSVQKLLSTADSGRFIRDGIKTAIAGKPNVGKSSLLNALAGEDRAIVTEIAGTTRDLIEEYINLGGVPLVLTDTAGIRDTDDTVEKIGVERSRRAVDEADLVLAVLDGSEDISSEDIEILEETSSAKRIIIVNKIDKSRLKTEQLQKYVSGSDVIEVSAKTGEGLELLGEKIKEMYDIGIERSDGAVITNLRHKRALMRAEEALSRAITSIDAKMPQDIAALDINEAIGALGEITGETVSDDIVNSIFHSFCVGK